MKQRMISTATPAIRSGGRAVFLSAAIGLWSAAPAAAEAEQAARSEPGVRIELNKLEATGNACRAYLLLENRSALSFESLKLDLVLFDREGVVAKRLAVETAPLPEEKTSLKVFDIAQLPCDAISRVLLNKLTACNDGQTARGDCLGLVSTASRDRVPFIK